MLEFLIKEHIDNARKIVEQNIFLKLQLSCTTLIYVYLLTNACFDKIMEISY